MSDKKRTQSIKNYLVGLINGLDKKELLDKYEVNFEGIKPQEVFEAFTSALDDGISVDEIIKVLNKAIRIFSLYLEPFDESSLNQISFLEILHNENKNLKNKLDNAKNVFLERDFEKTKKELSEIINYIEEYESHLVKKENILFAYMEKKSNIYNGLSIMWEVHNQIRAWRKNAKSIISQNDVDEKNLSKQIGEIYFLAYGLFEKEELFMFPAALNVFSKTEFEEMKTMSSDENKISIKDHEKKEQNDNLIYKSETGDLSFDQLRAIFSALPVDISYVDENNKFIFFSDSGGRIFPRSAASLGRDVKRCHPPQSYKMVEDIIESFKSGKESSAKFWINFKGKKILISYYALKNDNGDYKGALEVTQDITEIKEIEGEKRLLDF